MMFPHGSTYTLNCNHTCVAATTITFTGLSDGRVRVTSAVKVVAAPTATAQHDATRLEAEVIYSGLIRAGFKLTNVAHGALAYSAL